MLRRIATLAPLVFLAAAPAGASAAPVTPLAPLAENGDGGPVLADGAVVFGRRSGSTLRVLSRPQAGGAAMEIGRATLASGEEGSYSLSGTTGGGIVFDGQGRSDSVVLAGPAAGPLASVPAPSLEGLDGASNELASAAGRLVVENPADGGEEDGRLRVFATGGTSRIAALPTGLNLSRLEVAGGLVAAPTTGFKRVVVFDLATDTVIRDLATGVPAPGTTVDFALGTDGTVALTRFENDSLSLVRAGPADTAFKTVLAEITPGPIEVDGTRIAYTRTTFKRNRTSRVVVADIADPTRALSVSPPAELFTDLGLQGDTVAYAMPGCAVVGAALGGAASSVLAKGPCVRTQVSSFGAIVRTRKGRTTAQVPVTCLAGPGDRCRVRLTASIDPPTLSDDPPRRVGRGSVTVRRGQTKTVRFRARGAVAKTLRKESFRLRTAVKLTDPGGRTRTFDVG